jgi:hypothetical protein
MTSPLSTKEIASLREKASRGATLSIDEVALFVAATRKSFLALPAPKSKEPKTAKPSTPENEIDFF